MEENAGEGMALHYKQPCGFQQLEILLASCVIIEKVISWSNFSISLKVSATQIIQEESIRYVR